MSGYADQVSGGEMRTSFWCLVYDILWDLEAVCVWLARMLDKVVCMIDRLELALSHIRWAALRRENEGRESDA